MSLVFFQFITTTGLVYYVIFRAYDIPFVSYLSHYLTYGVLFVRYLLKHNTISHEISFFIYFRFVAVFDG